MNEGISKYRLIDGTYKPVLELPNLEAGHAIGFMHYFDNKYQRHFALFPGIPDFSHHNDQVLDSFNPKHELKNLVTANMSSLNPSKLDNGLFYVSDAGMFAPAENGTIRLSSVAPDGFRFSNTPNLNRSLNPVGDIFSTRLITATLISEIFNKPVQLRFSEMGYLVVTSKTEWRPYMYVNS